MKEKTRFVSFYCNIKLCIYTFLLPLLYICIRYFHEDEYQLCNPAHSLKILKYNLPYLFYLYLPKILSIVLVLIVEFNTKRESNSSNENIVLKNYHISFKKNNRLKVLLFIYIISLIESLHDDADTLLYYYEIYQEKEGEEKYIKGWLVEEKSFLIIFVPLFSYLILRTEIHKHHFLAFLLGFFGVIIVNGCRFFLGFSYIKDFPFHLLKMFFCLLYALSLVLIKYTMTIKHIILSPYIFLFYDGIFNIINTIILSLLQYVIVINLPDQNRIVDGIEENNKYFSNNFLEIIKILTGQERNFYIFFFLSFIFSFFYYVIDILIIYNYSPFIIILVEVLLPVDTDVIKVFLGTGEKYIEENKSSILERFSYQTIGYIFLLFGALILNEIIILNFWDLNKYTFKNINERGELDINSSVELDDFTETSKCEED